MRSLVFFERVWQDVRQGSRGLTRNAGFALVAVSTLAVGIGFNAAMFSFVDAALLKPLPYEHGDRIVRISEKRPNGVSAWISTPTFLDWKTDNTVFDKMAAQQDGLAILTGPDEPVPLRVSRVTAEYFEIFRTTAFLGRTFASDEDQPGKEHVVVLSHAVWQTQFGGDASIIGRSIVLDDDSFTVIGVTPPGSAFDRGSAQVWYPLAFKPANMVRDYHWLTSSFAVLKSGVALEQARAQLDRVSARIGREYPDSNRGWGVSVDLYADSIVGPGLRLSLLVLMAAVGGLLLICCSNLANLALSRAVSREREVAMRTSLGASRLRLLQQFLIENIVLAACGGVLGIGFGYAGIAGLAALLPAGSFPREMTAQLDLRVLMFAGGLSILAGVLFGLAPALHALRPRLAGSMNEGGRSTTAGTTGARLRDAFVVAEVAMAFLLLSGSGLLIRSFFSLLQVDTGFESANVLTMRLPVPGFPPGSAYSSPEQFTAYLRALQTSIAAVPGVRQIAFTNSVPLTDCCLYGLSLQVANRLEVDRANRGGGFFKVVTPSYFSALGLKLKNGRFLTDQDTASGRRVIVVNERLAKQYFANENPVGQQVLNPEIVPGKTQRGPDVAWEIVGVVADEKISALNDAPSPVIYASYQQSPVYFTNAMIRTGADAASMERSVRQAIFSVNKSQAVLDVRTLDQIKAGSVVSSRFEMILLVAFAAVALGLAGIGIYGVLSYSVAQRTHELGIRGALGASPSNLMRLVLAKGLVLTTAGLAIGLAGASVLMSFLTPILYKVDAGDPITLASGVLVIFLAATTACVLPARRVMRIDPVNALRME